MSENYPEGTYNHPDAPWNKPGNPEKEIEVTVILTLIKTVKIKTSDYEILDSGKDEEGEYFEDVDYYNLKDNVESQTYLPYEAYRYVDDKDIKQDLSNWSVDEFIVIPE